MILAYNEAKKNEIRQANMLMHLEGLYFMDALVATVCNMFRNKGSMAYEYPKEPYALNLEDEIANTEDKEIELKRRQFVTQLNNLFRDIDTAIEEKKNGGEH